MRAYSWTGMVISMIVLENDFIKVRLSEFAGHIESIVNKADNEEHYWQYNGNIWPRRTSICFPICGGLLDEEYEFNKEKYHLPMHGFVRENYLKVENISTTEAILSFTSSEETKTNYPFDFVLLVKYKVIENSFYIEYVVQNRSTYAMYFSIGSHYTYKLPDIQRNCRYDFSDVQFAKSYTQQNRIIGEKEETVFNGKSFLSMDHLFDVASKIYDVKDLSTEYIAISNREKLFTKVEFKGFEFVVLWAPKGNNSPFVCIEPWAGMADFYYHDKDITKKKGIICLDSGQNKSFTQIISVF